ncbi:MAG: hypothetical protein H7Z19_02590, partial [Chitinophagaceae bacterium]|nr:hypothetical protein [Rubrivivax sp.]
VPVPSHITEIDLVRAVTAGVAPTGDELPLGPSVNTLRECVDRWPESIYQWHDAPQRAQLDVLFRQLAFKDPNTGLYSQQRIDVDAGAALLGAGKTRADLRALVGEGFLGSVDYLFWDDEDPARVTLKVSHESFIRGWGHFRRLIDEQSRHFDEFLGVLRKCAAWVAGERGDDFLLEAGELRRLGDSGFAGRWANPAQREAWFRLLRLVRDGPQLAAFQPQLDGFLTRANQRLRDGELRKNRTRRGWFALGALTLLLVPSASFSVFIQAPVIDRAGLLFAAGNRANRAPLTPDYPGVGAASSTLESLLRAAELVDIARSGSSSRMAGLSQLLLDRFSWIGPVRDQDGFLKGVAAQAEPPVNGKLRLLLGTALWRSAGVAAGSELPPPVVNEDASCVPRDGESGASQAVPGRLFVASGRDGSTQQRAIFLPQAEGEGKSGVVLRSASFDPVNGQCLYGAIVLSIPVYLNPYVVFDAGLRYFLYTAYGENVEIASVTLHEIDWDRSESGVVRVLQSEVRTIVTSPEAVAAVIRAAGPGRAGV